MFNLILSHHPPNLIYISLLTVKIIFKAVICTLFPVNLLTKFVWSRPLSARSCFIRFTMLACLYSAAASMAVWPYIIKHCIERSHLFILISSVNFIWVQFKINKYNKQSCSEQSLYPTRSAIFVFLYTWYKLCSKWIKNKNW